MGDDRHQKVRIMKTRTYAREITKEYLKGIGVESVSEDGTTVIYRGVIKPVYDYYSGKRQYKCVQLFDNAIRQQIPVEDRTSSSGQFRIGMHVINYVWNIADKPAGYVIDHIDNNSLNNHVSNLQILTPRENVNKEKDRPPRIVKMPKYITEEEILRKLKGYEEAYEQAKKDHDADAAHKLRGYISTWRAKHRMFLEDPDKYTKKSGKKLPTPLEHECHARAEKRRELQANVDSSRKFYKEVLAAYGKDDPIVKQYWGEWKLAIAMLNGFKEECKRAKQAETIC